MTTDPEETAIAKRMRTKLVARGLTLGENGHQDQVWNEVIAMMARWKSMSAPIQADEEQSDFRRQLNARIQGRIMAELVVAGLWTSPWIQVAQDEFPGIEFDQAQVDQLIAQLPEEIERHNRIEHLSAPQPADMVAFLKDRGYEVQAVDRELVTSLAVQHLARQFMAVVMGRGDKVTEPDFDRIFRQILTHASQSRNGVWVAFVRHFYPHPADESP